MIGVNETKDLLPRSNEYVETTDNNMLIPYPKYGPYVTKINHSNTNYAKKYVTHCTTLECSCDCPSFAVCKDGICVWRLSPRDGGKPVYMTRKGWKVLIDSFEDWDCPSYLKQQPDCLAWYCDKRNKTF